MPNPSAPWWTLLLQPLSTLFVGLTAGYIAYHQWKLARLKQQHELYPSRIRIMKHVMRFISTLVSSQMVTPEELYEYSKETIESPFLFGSEIVSFVESVRDKAVRIMVCNESILKDLQMGDALAETQARLLNTVIELDNQFKEGVDLFEPYLSFASIKQNRFSFKRWLRRRFLVRQGHASYPWQFVLNRLKKL